jgi:hypothetical protein
VAGSINWLLLRLRLPSRVLLKEENGKVVVGNQNNRPSCRNRAGAEGTPDTWACRWTTGAVVTARVSPTIMSPHLAALQVAK